MSANVVEQDLADEALAWPARAKTIEVRDTASYQHAAGSLIIIKGLLQKIEMAYAPHIKRANDMHKGLIAARNEQSAPLQAAEVLLKTSLARYDEQQAALRRLEQERLRRDAVAQEEQRRLDEAARLKDEAAATGNVELLQEAAMLLEQPVEVPAIFVPEPPPTPGIVHRESWRAEVLDLRKLICCVAARPDLTHLLQPNLVALNQMARAQRDRLQIDGVVAVRTNVVAVSSK